MRWDPPGPGTWWLELEHFPRPVSRLFADLFPPVTEGWSRGARRYGDTTSPARWGTSNDWLYYGPALDPPPPDPSLEGVAGRAREERWWRDEVRRWHDEERPRVVATNLELQREDLAPLDAGGLADHVRRVFEHYSTAAPLHFEHAGNHVCNDVLREAAAAAGFPDLDIAALATGSSPASSRPAVLVRTIVDALVAAGVDEADRVSSLDDVRAASADAGGLLDAYIEEYGWRLVDSYDPSYPALVERPSVILTSIRAGLAGHWRGDPRTLPVDLAPPWDDDPLLDELLADARALHAMRDDDDGACFFWPMGLVRRAVLEAGGRLVAEGRLVAATDLFDATSAEILGLLGGASSPDAAELSRRASARAAAGAVAPPPTLGGPGPAAGAAPPAARDAGDGTVRRLTGTPIGTGVGTGRVRIHRSGDDVLGSIEPGDVLVAVTTTPAFNTVFRLLAAVVTETGSVRSHCALLSRELGLPAVVAVAGAMGLPEGALVEVDGDTGVCTLVS